MRSLTRFVSSSFNSLFASARARCHGYLTSSAVKPGCLEHSRDASIESVGGLMQEHAWGSSGNIGPSLRANAVTPCALSFRRFIYSDSRRNTESGRNSRSMNFVRGILEEDGKDIMGGSQFPRYNVEQNADVVHMKLMRNNTFITVTDSKGNTKLKASAGRLEELKGGPKLSRYAAEAIAEYVGRESRKLGLKSVIMRVNGFTYFKKKRQAIMSWREGFTDSRGDQNPVVYIEDTTRRPHNGCRLPKKRRV